MRAQPGIFQFTLGFFIYIMVKYTLKIRLLYTNLLYVLDDDTHHQRHYSDF